LRVPPEAPADRLAGDPALAERTRRAAPSWRAEDTGRDTGAVVAFLEDEEKVEAIRKQAREEAEQRAEEWNF
jgi:hypothetical protein